MAVAPESTCGLLIGDVVDDPAVDPAQLAVAIAWGDGASGAGLVGPGASSGVFFVTTTQCHTYAAGMYRASATVTDAAGRTAVVSREIDAVADLTGQNNKPQFAQKGVAMQTVEVGTVSSGPAGAGDADDLFLGSDKVAIDWGDGATTAGSLIPNGNNWVVYAGSHAYAAVGTYKLTGTVTDDDGSSVMVQTTVTVS